MNLLLYSAIIATLWGISPIAHKLCLDKMNPKVFFCINSVFVTISILTFSFLNRSEFFPEFSKLGFSDFKNIALMALCLSFIPALLYYSLLQKHESYKVSVLVHSSPIITILLSYFVLNEEISQNSFMGIILVITGIFLLSHK